MTKDVRMRGFQERTHLKDVHALIDQRISALGRERLPFHQAIGRVLAEDLVATENVPPHAKSAMDGYAVRAEDTPGELQIVGQLMADDRFDETLAPNQAVRIMTGAKVPDGANAVVMVENTETNDQTVNIKHNASHGEHVLAIGEDLTEGEPVLHTGRKLRPQDISMLVRLNALEVEVFRRPRVRIIPTGTELTRIGASDAQRKVVESNSYMLHCLAQRDGAEITMHPIVRDDMDLLRAAVSSPGADLIVMTGGSSVGQEDLGPVVVREIGELPVHGVHMKPGSPTGFGFVNDTPIVLAPGYPVATLIAWDMIVRPIVQKMQAAPTRIPYATTSGVLAKAHRKPAKRVEFQRVTLEDGQVTVLKGGAALLSTATKADGFIIVDTGVDELPAGESVTVYLYD